MYPVPVGVSFLVSQRVSGTGRFNGSDHGRARSTVANVDPNAVVRLAARRYGVEANALTVEFVDRGVGNAVAATRVERAGSALRVVLRRGTGGAPLATAAEVAAAINGFAPETGNPVGAAYGGDGTGVVSAAAPQPFAGGAAPATDRIYSYRWAPANTDLGFFHVEQESPVLVRQLQARFTVPSGTRRLIVSRVPVNRAFEADLAEAVPLLDYAGLTTAAPDLTVSDVNWILPPGWALVAETDVSLAGVVRMDFRRDI